MLYTVPPSVDRQRKRDDIVVETDSPKKNKEGLTTDAVKIKLYMTSKNQIE